MKIVPRNGYMDADTGELVELMACQCTCTVFYITASDSQIVCANCGTDCGAAQNTQQLQP